MSPVAVSLQRLVQEIADETTRFGRTVNVNQLNIIDRSGEIRLGPARQAISPNGSCRMIRAADGWIALNLARAEDRDLVPAWLGSTWSDDPWALAAAHAPQFSANELRDRAVMLGLPGCRVGEMGASVTLADQATKRDCGRSETRKALKVLDLSTLWAGPLCGAVLAAMGAEVTRIESVGRSDPTRTHAPGFFKRLNGAKTDLALDLTTVAAQARLRALIRAADVVITNARPRGLASIGVDPHALMAERPTLTWVAITGYGWRSAPGDEVGRVAFGDDAAAAGGLVGWTTAGEPYFLGDALADPLAGLTAARDALRALSEGGGAFVDVGLAQAAASAASLRLTARAA